VATDHERLDLLYDLSKRLASMQGAGEVIHYATRRIRDFFHAGGCSILLLDRSRQEFHFPVSAQGRDSAVTSEALSQMRFPADQGIAGWVRAHDEGLWVADTAADPRFYQGIDAETGAVTRSLLCVPLRTVAGVAGVVEVINPVVSETPADDVAFLTAVASDVGMAYEKAELQRRIRHEANELRYIGYAAGCAITGAGLAAAAFAAFGHLARARPAAQLVVHSGVLAGLAVAAAGVGVLLAVRRAVARRTIRS